MCEVCCKWYIPRETSEVSKYDYVNKDEGLQMLICRNCKAVTHLYCHGIKTEYTTEGVYNFFLCDICTESSKISPITSSSLLSSSITTPTTITITIDSKRITKKKCKICQCYEPKLMKKTIDGEWVHIMCALTSNDVELENIETMLFRYKPKIEPVVGKKSKKRYGTSGSGVDEEEKPSHIKQEGQIDEKQVDQEGGNGYKQGMQCEYCHQSPPIHGYECQLKGCGGFTHLWCWYNSKRRDSAAWEFRIELLAQENQNMAIIPDIYEMEKEIFGMVLKTLTMMKIPLLSQVWKKEAKESPKSNGVSGGSGASGSSGASGNNGSGGSNGASGSSGGNVSTSGVSGNGEGMEIERSLNEICKMKIKEVLNGFFGEEKSKKTSTNNGGFSNGNNRIGGNYTSRCIEHTDPVYCTCRQSEDADANMVCCDNCGQWWHAKCLIEPTDTNDQLYCIRCQHWDYLKFTSLNHLNMDKLKVKYKDFTSKDEFQCIPKDTSTFNILEYLIIALIFHTKLTKIAYFDKSIFLKASQTIRYIPLNIRGILLPFLYKHLVNITIEQVLIESIKELPKGLYSMFDLENKRICKENRIKNKELIDNMKEYEKILGKYEGNVVWKTTGGGVGGAINASTNVGTNATAGNIGISTSIGTNANTNTGISDNVSSGVSNNNNNNMKCFERYKKQYEWLRKFMKFIESNEEIMKQDEEQVKKKGDEANKIRLDEVNKVKIGDESNKGKLDEVIKSRIDEGIKSRVDESSKAKSDEFIRSKLGNETPPPIITRPKIHKKSYSEFIQLISIASSHDINVNDYTELRYLMDIKHRIDIIRTKLKDCFIQDLNDNLPEPMQEELPTLINNNNDTKLYEENLTKLMIEVKLMLDNNKPNIEYIKSILKEIKDLPISLTTEVGILNRELSLVVKWDEESSNIKEFIQYKGLFEQLGELSIKPKKVDEFLKRYELVLRLYIKIKIFNKSMKAYQEKSIDMEEENEDIQGRLLIYENRQILDYCSSDLIELMNQINEYGIDYGEEVRLINEMLEKEKMINQMMDDIRKIERVEVKKLKELIKLINKYPMKIEVKEEVIRKVNEYNRYYDYATSKLTTLEGLLKARNDYIEAFITLSPITVIGITGQAKGEGLAGIPKEEELAGIPKGEGLVGVAEGGGDISGGNRVDLDDHILKRFDNRIREFEVILKSYDKLIGGTGTTGINNPDYNEIRMDSIDNLRKRIDDMKIILMNGRILNKLEKQIQWLYEFYVFMENGLMMNNNVEIEEENKQHDIEGRCIEYNQYQQYIQNQEYDKQQQDTLHEKHLQQHQEYGQKQQEEQQQYSQQQQEGEQYGQQQQQQQEQQQYAQQHEEQQQQQQHNQPQEYGQYQQYSQDQHNHSQNQFPQPIENEHESNPFTHNEQNHYIQLLGPNQQQQQESGSRALNPIYDSNHPHPHPHHQHHHVLSSHNTNPLQLIQSGSISSTSLTEELCSQSPPPSSTIAIVDGSRIPGYNSSIGGSGIPASSNNKTPFASVQPPSSSSKAAIAATSSLTIESMIRSIEDKITLIEHVLKHHKEIYIRKLLQGLKIQWIYERIQHVLYNYASYTINIIERYYSQANITKLEYNTGVVAGASNGGGSGSGGGNIRVEATRLEHSNTGGRLEASSNCDSIRLEHSNSGGRHETNGNNGSIKHVEHSNNEGRLEISGSGSIKLETSGGINKLEHNSIGGVTKLEHSNSGSTRLETSMGYSNRLEYNNSSGSRGSIQLENNTNNTSNGTNKLDNTGSLIFSKHNSLGSVDNPNDANDNSNALLDHSTSITTNLTYKPDNTPKTFPVNIPKQQSQQQQSHPDNTIIKPDPIVSPKPDFIPMNKPELIPMTKSGVFPMIKPDLITNNTKLIIDDTTLNILFKLKLRIQYEPLNDELNTQLLKIESWTDQFNKIFNKLSCHLTMNDYELLGSTINDICILDRASKDIPGIDKKRLKCLRNALICFIWIQKANEFLRYMENRDSHMNRKGFNTLWKEGMLISRLLIKMKCLTYTKIHEVMKDLMNIEDNWSKILHSMEKLNSGAYTLMGYNQSQQVYNPYLHNQQHSQNQPNDQSSHQHHHQHYQSSHHHHHSHQGGYHYQQGSHHHHHHHQSTHHHHHHSGSNTPAGIHRANSSNNIMDDNITTMIIQKPDIDTIKGLLEEIIKYRGFLNELPCLSQLSELYQNYIKTMGLIERIENLIRNNPLSLEITTLEELKRYNEIQEMLKKLRFEMNNACYFSLWKLQRKMDKYEWQLNCVICLCKVGNKKVTEKKLKELEAKGEEYVKANEGYAKGSEGHFKGNEGYAKGGEGNPKSNEGYSKESEGYPKGTEDYSRIVAEDHCRLPIDDNLTNTTIDTDSIELMKRLKFEINEYTSIITTFRKWHKRREEYKKLKVEGTNTSSNSNISSLGNSANTGSLGNSVNTSGLNNNSANLGISNINSITQTNPLSPDSFNFGMTIDDITTIITRIKNSCIDFDKIERILQDQLAKYKQLKAILNKKTNKSMNILDFKHELDSLALDIRDERRLFNHIWDEYQRLLAQYEDIKGIKGTGLASTVASASASVGSSNSNINNNNIEKSSMLKKLLEEYKTLCFSVREFDDLKKTYDMEYDTLTLIEQHIPSSNWYQLGSLSEKLEFLTNKFFSTTHKRLKIEIWKRHVYLVLCQYKKSKLTNDLIDELSYEELIRLLKQGYSYMNCTDNVKVLKKKVIELEMFIMEIEELIKEMKDNGRKGEEKLFGFIKVNKAMKEGVIGSKSSVLDIGKLDNDEQILQKIGEMKTLNVSASGGGTAITGSGSGSGGGSKKKKASENTSGNSSAFQDFVPTKKVKLNNSQPKEVVSNTQGSVNTTTTSGSGTSHVERSNSSGSGGGGGGSGSGSGNASHPSGGSMDRNTANATGNNNNNNTSHGDNSGSGNTDRGVSGSSSASGGGGSTELDKRLAKRKIGQTKLTNLFKNNKYVVKKYPSQCEKLGKALEEAYYNAYFESFEIYQHEIKSLLTKLKVKLEDIKFVDFLFTQKVNFEQVRNMLKSKKLHQSVSVEKNTATMMNMGISGSSLGKNSKKSSHQHGETKKDQQQIGQSGAGGAIGSGKEAQNDEMKQEIPQNASEGIGGNEVITASANVSSGNAHAHKPKNESREMSIEKGSANTIHNVTLTIETPNEDPSSTLFSSLYTIKDVQFVIPTISTVEKSKIKAGNNFPTEINAELNSIEVMNHLENEKESERLIYGWVNFPEIKGEELTSNIETNTLNNKVSLLSPAKTLVLGLSSLNNSGIGAKSSIPGLTLPKLIEMLNDGKKCICNQKGNELWRVYMFLNKGLENKTWWKYYNKTNGSNGGTNTSNIKPNDMLFIYDNGMTQRIKKKENANSQGIKKIEKKKIPYITGQ